MINLNRTMRICCAITIFLTLRLIGDTNGFQYASSLAKLESRRYLSQTVDKEVEKSDNKAMAFLRKIGKVGNNQDFTNTVGIDEGSSGKTAGQWGRGSKVNSETRNEYFLTRNEMLTKFFFSAAIRRCESLRKRMNPA